jgi:hypothetical protein
MFYSSKLLRELSKKLGEPWKLSYEPWKSLSDIDLYTVLPKAKSEPIYVKSDWERELEVALKESRVKRPPAPQFVLIHRRKNLLFRSKRNDRPVLLNLPVQILEQVDMAVREQGVSRSQFLRQAVERNLRHYQRCERALFARIYQQGMS